MDGQVTSATEPLSTKDSALCDYVAVLLREMAELRLELKTLQSEYVLLIEESRVPAGLSPAGGC
jgi:hypothetical protein